VLAETDVFDIIVRGEGEATIVSLMDALARGDPLSTIRDIALYIAQADWVVYATFAGLSMPIRP